MDTSTQSREQDDTREEELRGRALKRSPAPLDALDAQPPTAKRARLSPSRSPSSSPPPLYVVTASPSAIVDDSHYASFGLGFSYDYAPTSPTSTSLQILGGEPFDPPLASTSNANEAGPGSLLNHLLPSKTCFNCSSPDHSLSNCPFRHDPITISQNRQIFQQNSGGASNYHRLSDRRNNPLLPSNEFVSQRARFLSYHSKFRPGIVSDELRIALGLNREGGGFVTEELPFIGRIAREGYPSGWTWFEDEMDPLEKSRKVIESRRGDNEGDWEFHEVEMLEIYGDQDDEKDQKEGRESSTEEEGPKETLPSITTAVESSPLPADPPPPLPPGAPPPLPPGPPPPPPPSEQPPRQILRQARYQTHLFDSDTHFLSFSPTRWYQSLNNKSVLATGDRGRGEQSGTSQGEAESDGEEEMDFGESSDEG